VKTAADDFDYPCGMHPYTIIYLLAALDRRYLS